MILKSILVLVSTVLLFNACVPKERIIYVNRDCPKLETYQYQTKKHSPLNIKYNIVEKPVQDIDIIDTIDTPN